MVSTVSKSFAGWWFFMACRSTECPLTHVCGSYGPFRLLSPLAGMRLWFTFHIWKRVSQIASPSCRTSASLLASTFEQRCDSCQKSRSANRSIFANGKLNLPRKGRPCLREPRRQDFQRSVFSRQTCMVFTRDAHAGCWLSMQSADEWVASDFLTLLCLETIGG